MYADVTPTARSLAELAHVVGADRAEELRRSLTDLRAALAGRTLWHVNSTATGGGVAEMLPFLIGYLRDAAIDARWVVVGGSPPFFAVTKRIHNALHGSPGDGGRLGDRERATYADVTRANASILTANVRPGDVVVLHDPQTAGLARPLRGAGATVVWRCHVGCDHPDEHTARAWRFLRPLLEPVDAYVFTRREHVPDWIPEDRLAIVPPSIDPLAPKNRHVDGDVTTAILRRAGLLAPTAAGAASGAPDADAGVVADVVRSEGIPASDVPLVVQISRWDRLKDMGGVLHGFASGVDSGSHLALVGPSVEGVSDDPEGQEVLRDCVAAWDGLPATVRRQVHLVCLPMDDVEANALTVNALQRHAAVVVQKSLQEGFGLTVTEAMWKRGTVVASAVGGIQDQIVHGEHGVLLVDPADLDGFAGAVQGVLDAPTTATRLGAAAERRARDAFLPDRHLRQYADLVLGLRERAS